MTTTDQALHLARLLYDRGKVEQALDVGRRGLKLQGMQHHLAPWVRDVTTTAGVEELAVQAAVTAFQATPSLDSYLLVREYTGSDWPEYRTQLVEHARNSSRANSWDLVGVFLHEGLIADAIGVADDARWDSRLTYAVANAAVDTHPDWVIEQSVRRADEIMNSARAKDYHVAAQWMALAKKAFECSGRGLEWRELLEDRLSRHQRKYKLRPMLERLD